VSSKREPRPYYCEFLIGGKWERIVSPSGGRYGYDDLEEAEACLEIIRAFGRRSASAGIRLIGPNGVDFEINELDA
jgi:hypothetical protein